MNAARSMPLHRRVGMLIRRAYITWRMEAVLREIRHLEDQQRVDGQLIRARHRWIREQAQRLRDFEMQD